jgi:hypothetical protein
VKTHRLVPVAAVAAALALMLGAVVALGGQAVSAQGTEAPHPAHIHNGTCDNLGDVVYPLSNVSGPTASNTGSPVAGAATGASNAIPVEMSVTTVQTTINDLLSQPYAINVHESQENIGNYVACGNIGGTVSGSDLAIGLGELNGSGYSGVAWLHDNGDGTTTVTIFLTHAGAAMGTPTANG